MRTIVMAVMALAIIGGAGVGAYFYFMNSAEAALTENGEHGEDSAHAGSKDMHAEADSHGGGHAFEFVELDPLILPIIDENGVNQIVSVVVALEVADAANASKVESYAPRLKDAFIQDMYGVLNEHAALKGGIVQVSVLKKRLNKVSDRVLGKDVVMDVLLQVVQQRPV